jgi:hypothetical protein
MGSSQAQLHQTVTYELDGDIQLKWATRNGALYEIERSADLVSWENIGFPIYGTVDSDPLDASTFASLQVYTVPPAGGNLQVPAIQAYMYFIKRDSDHTMVTWASRAAGNGMVSAYIDDDWRFQNVPGGIGQFLTRGFAITNNGPAYHIGITPLDFAAVPSPAPLAANLGVEDQAFLALFTGAKPDVEAALLNPPPVSPAPSVSNSTAAEDYFRITELAVDSDGDGILDWHETALGWSPISKDTNQNGVEDPWDGISNTLVISEFQAANDSTTTDEDGDYEDWLEILNPTTLTVSLDGWFLTDKPGGEPGDVADPDKWAFPSGISIPPGGTLLVWASNKDRGAPNEALHTNFALSAANEGVGIVNPQGTLVDSHRWTVRQVEDRSAGWGIDNFVGTADGDTRKLRYFGNPTPGALNNTTAYKGVCAEPEYTVPGGIYSGAPFTVTLSTELAGTIRYTTDFTAPGEESLIFDAPITVNGTTIIRSVVTAPGCLPSPVVSASYLFKESVLGTEPQGNLPTDHQQKPAGYSDARAGSELRIDYAMDPVIIQANKDALLAELSAIPTVSVVLPPEDFFELNQGGIYANSSISEDDDLDPKDANWRRLASIEYFNPATGQRDQENGRLSIAGGKSILPSTSPKHNMKIEFRKEITFNQEGVMAFSYAPIADSSQKKFRTLMLRNATQDSWVFVPGGVFREQSTYIKESWARATQTAMGHLTAHRRWVHLYVDGLYWGIYEFGERINEDFMQDYSQEDAQYDVLKQFTLHDEN